MRTSHKYLLAVGLVSLGAYAFLGLAGWLLWADLEAHEQQALAAMLAARGPLVALPLVALPVLVAVLLRSAFARYPVALRRLAEQVRVVHSANPAHAPDAGGATEVRDLADAVRALAQAYAASQQQVRSRIEEANARLAQEKNQLAVLMAEMAQSVVVCNREGRILLYNERAASLLGPAGSGSDMPLGLGRSVFGVLDRGPLLHAMAQLAARAEAGSGEPVAHFVTLRGGQLLRAQMAPVPDVRGGMAGFVLILEDVTRSVEAAGRRDALLQQLTEGTRSALANIRAAAETLQAYPDMEEVRRSRFLDAIREDAQKLSGRLEAALAAHEPGRGAAWPREDLAAADLVAALRREAPGVQLLWEPAAGEMPWLSVDSHALVQGLTQLVRRIAQEAAPPEVGVRFDPGGRWVRVSLDWQGPAVSPAQVQEWAGAPPGDAAGLTLQQVLEQHGAEMWRAPAGGGRHSVCLQLPAAEPAQPRSAARPGTPGRPVYYDFDLFAQAGLESALDERPLAELACTVFDTETTGLSPSEGDEMIAIGAVRVLNGRLLAHETFDRLVRPLRAVRKEAQAVHGISQEMLAGQPPLEEVLPAFHRFAQDTVLVAHNAAFDMRLLQMAQARTGIVFAQPVLDTLLLSALVHPDQEDAQHRLEAIALRLGVPVVGRHTALGDALVTAEVFLKLVPLLAARGIRTLREAREASQKTVYAKLDY